MEKASDHLDNIISKINILLQNYVQLQEDHLMLKEENRLLQNKIQQQKQTMEDIDKQLQFLKLAKSSAADEGEKQELKQQLNKYIREIDKCISLLNG